PTCVEDLDVIVEEHEQVASSSPGAPVVHRRVIERLIPPDHGERKALSLVPLFVRGRALTVVDDDDVERPAVVVTQPGEELVHRVTEDSGGTWAMRSGCTALGTVCQASSSGPTAKLPVV